MANKTTRLNVTEIKPSSDSGFDPIFEVETCEARAKNGGEYVYLTFKPISGGAGNVGKIVIRAPTLLTSGSVLASVARLVGQDPKNGFNVPAAVGTRVRLAFTSVPAEPEPSKKTK